MSSRFPKFPSHTHDEWTVISTESDNGTSDKVTYLSKNNRDGRHFEAVSSPNSIHAKKLAELALLVQSNQREQRKPVAALPSSGQRVARIAPGVYQTHVPRIQDVTTPADLPEFRNSGTAQVPVIRSGDSMLSQPNTQAPAVAYASSSSYYSPQHIQRSSISQSQHSSPHSGHSQLYTVLPPETSRSYTSELRRVPEPSYQAPDVYRYSNERQTGYRVSTASGELKVSAPVGSSEAREFDEVAEKLTSKVSEVSRRSPFMDISS